MAKVCEVGGGVDDEPSKTGFWPVTFKLNIFSPSQGGSIDASQRDLSEYVLYIFWTRSVRELLAQYLDFHGNVSFFRLYLLNGAKSHRRQWAQSTRLGKIYKI